jgi:hypothetical protein
MFLSCDIVEVYKRISYQQVRQLSLKLAFFINAFGSQSAAGCRFVERLLTVTQTLRLQGRRVWTFLRDSLIAHRQGQSLPKLVKAG